MTVGRGVFVHNSSFRNNGQGIDVTGASGEATRVTVDSSSFESNNFGVYLTNKVNGVIRNSIITNNATTGISATSKDPTLLGQLLVDNCQVHQNPVGIGVSVGGRGGQILRRSRSTITDSSIGGVSATAATGVYSLGDNVFGVNSQDVIGSGLFTTLAKK